MAGSSSARAQASVLPSPGRGRRWSGGGFVTAGPADGEPTSSTGEVYALNVDPASWGRGFGAALLDSGVQALAATGFHTAVLWVHPENRRARHFYEQRGWTVDRGTRDQDVLGVVVPEVRYRARLTDRRSEDG